MHTVLLAYIDGHPEDETSDILDIAQDLLCDLLAQRKDVETPLNFDPSSIEALLRLPTRAIGDPDKFPDAATAVANQLLYPDFQSAVLTNRQLPAAFELLEMVASGANRACFPKSESELRKLTLSLYST